MEALLHDWQLWARENQLPPKAKEWTTWLVLGGRGAGKTRTGAEWIRGMALGREPFTAAPVQRIALVGETFASVRNVMIEGVSGILAIHPPHERPKYEVSKSRLVWPNGTVAEAFSAEDPDSLRGPQFSVAWADEVAKWREPEKTWDMLQFALRLGERPRQVVTTTPRPIPIIRRLMADPRTSITNMPTEENAENLAPTFLEEIVGRYRGTRLGRQELNGEVIEERPDALWSRDKLEAIRVSHPAPLHRIVVAVDPPTTSHAQSDACGIVAVGLGEDKIAYVLADESIEKATPALWATKAAALYHRLNADKLIAETNQGGDMVKSVLASVDDTLAIETVHASRGKWLRAEPIAAAYERGRVRHVGLFAQLEDEMCDFSLNGLSNGRSPDRMDALVWALTALLLKENAEPRIKMI